MGPYDIKQLQVGDDVAMDVSGRRSYSRSTFRFCKVTRVTKTQVEVEWAGPNSNELYKFSRVTGNQIGADKSWGGGYSLCAATYARDRLEAQKNMDILHAFVRDCKDELIRIKEGTLFSVEAGDRLIALGEKIKAKVND